MDFIYQIASRIASEPLDKRGLESKYKQMEISLTSIWKTMDEIKNLHKDKPSGLYEIIQNTVDELQKDVEDLREDTELRFR